MGDENRRIIFRRILHSSSLSKRDFPDYCSRMDRKSPDIHFRTRSFALEIIRLYDRLAKIGASMVIANQLVRSGTSVGAHIREAKRSRSLAEMISKTEVALQELEETVYWFELLALSGIVKPDSMTGLFDESKELTAMLVSSVRTLKRRTQEEQRRYDSDKK